MKTNSFALLLLIFLMSSCRDVKQPDYRGFSNFKIDNLGGKESLIKLDLDYYNPNHFGVRLKEADFDVFLDDDSLGHASLDSMIRIAPQSNFTVPVRLSAPTKVLLKHSLALLLNKQVFLKVKGTAKVGKAGIYKRYPIYYEGLQTIQQ